MKVDYLDASAWVKRYYQEPGTEATQALFVEGAVLACASLGIVEVLATLARKRKARQINETQFQQKQIEVESDWQQFIQVQLSPDVLANALILTANLSLRGAECCPSRFRHRASAKPALPRMCSAGVRRQRVDKSRPRNGYNNL